MVLIYIGLFILLSAIAGTLFRLRSDPARQAAKLATMSPQERREVYERILRFSPEMREKTFAVSPGLRALYEELSAQPPPGSAQPPNS